MTILSSAWADEKYSVCKSYILNETSGWIILNFKILIQLVSYLRNRTGSTVFTLMFAPRMDVLTKRHFHMSIRCSAETQCILQTLVNYVYHKRSACSYHVVAKIERSTDTIIRAFLSGKKHYCSSYKFKRAEIVLTYRCTYVEDNIKL